MDNAKILLHKKFDDFEQLKSAIHVWQLDFRQLDCGTSPSTILQVQSPNVLLSHVHLSHHYEQSAGTPAGYITFAILEEHVFGTHICEEALNANSLVLSKSASQFDAVSFNHFLFTPFQ